VQSADALPDDGSDDDEDDPRSECCSSLDVSEGEDSNIVSSPDAYAVSLGNLGALVKPLSRVIVSILAQRCADTLRLVRSVASQYRSAGIKREPTAASYFVPAILKSLREFFDRERGGLGSGVEADYGAGIRTAVVEDVAQRCAAKAFRRLRSGAPR
jgi:hypothetical protein